MLRPGLLHAGAAPGIRPQRGRSWPRGVVLVLAALLAAGAAAPGAQPMDSLKQSIEDGLKILKDPDFQPADRKPLQQQKLREVLYRDFDFAEFSQRVLADKWVLFSPEQRREFVGVFARFLADHYLARLQQHYADEKVVVQGQQILAPGRARVRVHLTWRNREFAVDVRLRLRGGSWMIYDLSVLGISAVQIYRAQFQEIMRTQSPAEVIDLIKGRLAE
jgi:phospholipid transport system substrate-binding protein